MLLGMIITHTKKGKVMSFLQDVSEHFEGSCALWDTMSSWAMRGFLNVLDTSHFFTEDPIEPLVCMVHLENISIQKCFPFGATWGAFEPTDSWAPNRSITLQSWWWEEHWFFKTKQNKKTLCEVLMHSQDWEQSRGTRSSVVGDLFKPWLLKKFFLSDKRDQVESWCQCLYQHIPLQLYLTLFLFSNHDQVSKA